MTSLSLKCFIAFTLTIGFSISNTVAQVPSNALRRVLQIHATMYGTAFTIDIDGRQYIVTAKHVVSALPDKTEAKIQLNRKSGWVDLTVMVYKCEDPVDIAVLVPKQQITVNFELEPTAAGMLVGQESEFVGFPYGFNVKYENQPDVFGIVKRGTVAAFVPQPVARTQTIILDGLNNKGFSGSPVVYRDLNKPGFVFKVAGVIVDYIPETTRIKKIKEEVPANLVKKEELANRTVIQSISDGKFYRVEETNQLVELNTGLATAWDIRSAVELIRKHPDGPLTRDDFEPPK